MKRLTPQAAMPLIGKRLTGIVVLTTGGIGLLFEGNRIIDMKGRLLDQAESVAEVLALKRRIELMGGLLSDPVACAPTRVAADPDHTLHVQPLDPADLDEAPVFGVPWEPTGASDQERNEVRARTHSTGRVIDDFTIDEGWE